MMDALLLGGAELLVWLEAHLLMTSVLAAALMLPGLVCCWAARRGAVVSRQTLTKIDERLTQICSAVELLTDTTESALQTAFAEIERLSNQDGAPGAALPRRVQTAARNGRTAREIAQSEGVSEGEIRLQLRLGRDETDQAADLPVLQ